MTTATNTSPATIKYSVLCSRLLVGRARDRGMCDLASSPRRLAMVSTSISIFQRSAAGRSYPAWVSLQRLLRRVCGLEALSIIPRVVEVHANFQAVVPLECVVHVRQHVDADVQCCEDLAIGENVPGLQVPLDAGLNLERSGEKGNMRGSMGKGEEAKSVLRVENGRFRRATIGLILRLNGRPQIPPEAALR